MDIAARLTAPFLAHLRHVVAHEHRLVIASDWAALDRLIRHHPVDLAVVDPCADEPARPDALQELVARYPSLPLVLYMALSPDALRITVELAALRLPQVVLRGFDDAPSHFRALLERQPARVIEAAMLARLAEPLDRVPAPLAHAIRDLFLSPLAFHSADQLAMAAGLTRRSLDRSLERAGFASARVLLAGARVARAYCYLRDAGYQIDDVARKAGYLSPRLLARQVQWATGRSPSTVRTSLALEPFITRLAMRLQRPAETHPPFQVVLARAGSG